MYSLRNNKADKYLNLLMTEINFNQSTTRICFSQLYPLDSLRYWARDDGPLAVLIAT